MIFYALAPYLFYAGGNKGKQGGVVDMAELVGNTDGFADSGWVKQWSSQRSADKDTVSAQPLFNDTYLQSWMLPCLKFLRSRMLLLTF
jgi:hypothetical protein